MLLFKKISFIAPVAIFLICSCGFWHVSKSRGNNPPTPPTPPTPPASSCTATTNLSYGSACSTTAGCTLSFVCPVLQQSQFQKFLGALSFRDLTAGSAEQLLISSITTVDEPALLQTTPGLMPKNWYSNATGDVILQCNNDNGQITCPLFGPVGSKFDIKGTLGDKDVTVHVTVVDDVSPIANTSALLVGGCGQFGTTYQRIFDCSERVTHFAGIGQNGGAAVDFTLGNPNPNWFLAACPVYTGPTTSQQCSWLSPMIETGNPVIGINRNPTNTGTQDTTSPDLGPPNGVTRFLWSGSLNTSPTYTFWQANGTDTTGNASCNGNNTTGLCAQYNSGSPTFTFNTFISTSPSTPDPINACRAAITANDNAFSGMIPPTTPYSWIIPSYPIMMTLTGGSGCSSGTTNSACNAQGFSAISTPTPSFLADGSNQSFLWSSSLVDSNDGWEFVGYDGFVIVDVLDDPVGVRCVSSAW